MVRNFLFHRVHPERDALWDPMDVKLFDKIIHFISTKYEIRLFEELVFDESIRNSKNKFATIMFDDGYKDNIEYALPILENYNVKASFYVVTNCIEQNIPTWTHILEHSFQHTKKHSLILPYDFLDIEFRNAHFNNKEERLKFVARLKPYLKTIPHSKREIILEQITSTFNDVPMPRVMMDWDDVRKLNNLGHYIGSHSVSHSMLGTMEDETDIKNELVESGAIIKRELGYFPLTISYPIGSYDDRTIRLSEESGYKIGLAVKQDIYNPTKDSIYEVPRIELYNESWFKTKLRISNVLENFKKLIRYK